MGQACSAKKGKAFGRGFDSRRLHSFSPLKIDDLSNETGEFTRVRMDSEVQEAEFDNWLRAARCTRSSGCAASRSSIVRAAFPRNEARADTNVSSTSGSGWFIRNSSVPASRLHLVAMVPSVS